MSSWIEHILTNLCNNSTTTAIPLHNVQWLKHLTAFLAHRENLEDYVLKCIDNRVLENRSSKRQQWY